MCQHRGDRTRQGRKARRGAKARKARGGDRTRTTVRGDSKTCRAKRAGRK